MGWLAPAADPGGDEPADGKPAFRAAGVINRAALMPAHCRQPAADAPALRQFHPALTRPSFRSAPSAGENSRCMPASQNQVARADQQFTGMELGL